MMNLKAELEDRYPLLASLRLYQHDDEPEQFASFLGLILAGLDRTDEAPLCFVVPRKDSLAAITTILYALSGFAKNFPSLVESYADKSFQIGQRVKLNPTGKIFEFGGLWRDHEAMFKLKFLNEEASSAWPVTEILRLEPTERKRPKGTNLDCVLARHVGSPSVFDELIGTRTFGNSSLARNHVLCLGSKSSLNAFFDSTKLTRDGATSFSSVRQLVSPGYIDSNGDIRNHDLYQSSGEPLVAVTSRLDYLASACERAARGSKVVIIDGAVRITDLSVFDRISETQNLVILAEIGEEERLTQLRDRGCRFWPLTVQEFALGSASTRESSIFGPIYRASQNRALLKIEIVECANDNLEMCCWALSECHKDLRNSGAVEGDETINVIGQLFSLLTLCSGLLSAPSQDEKQKLLARLEVIRNRAADRFIWISDSQISMLRQAYESLFDAISDSDLGSTKGRKLKAILAKEPSEKVSNAGIVARGIAHRELVRHWLETENLAVPAMVPSSIEGFYDSLIVPTWPNSVNFGKLVSKQATPLLKVLAYPFEVEWARGFERKLSRTSFLPSLSKEEKALILNFASDAESSEPQEVPEQVPENEVDRTPRNLEQVFARRDGIRVAVSGEDSVPARLLVLSGDAYVFLTEAARVPVVTGFILGDLESGRKVPRKTVAEIQVGDILVFRDGGRRDVIQAMADAQMGPDANSLREMAARWHKALRDSGLDENSLVRELTEVNCPRTYQTVRAWLSDDAMIGPQTKEDLEAIAYALADHVLLEQVPEIWRAIQRLRSEHLSAGMRLSEVLLERLPERMINSWTGQARIEIDSSTRAWLLQVESIEDHVEYWSRNNVNTILWKNEGT